MDSIEPHYIAVWVQKDRCWKITGTPRNCNNMNFVIVCWWGDWSGYRTWEGCIGEEMPDRTVENYFFIEER